MRGTVVAAFAALAIPAAALSLSCGRPPAAGALCMRGALDYVEMQQQGDGKPRAGMPSDWQDRPMKDINRAGPSAAREAQVAELMRKVRARGKGGADSMESAAREAEQALKRPRPPPPPPEVSDTPTELTVPAAEQEEAPPREETAKTTTGVGGSWAAAGDTTNLPTMKPKVSTWGVFERPADVSKAYGGGRRIGVGGFEEDAEERKRKQARRVAICARAARGRRAMHLSSPRKMRRGAGGDGGAARGVPKSERHGRRQRGVARRRDPRGARRVHAAHAVWRHARRHRGVAGRAPVLHVDDGARRRSTARGALLLLLLLLTMTMMALLLPPP